VGLYLSIFVALLGPVTVATVTGLRTWRRRVGLARNTSETCAQCGKTWTAKEFGTIEAYIVEGQFVCGECAPKMRLRVAAVTAAFGLAAGTVVYFGWGQLIDAFTQQGLAGVLVSLSHFDGFAAAIAPFVIVGSGVWAQQRMKRENVIALETMARLRIGPSTEERGAGSKSST
jgi:hypothetical protein